MDASTPRSLPAADRDVVITRTFAAPLDLVFRAWTQPEMLQRWYAPQGCTVRFIKLDVRPGGTFHSCIHNPDFPDCWCIGVYQEVVVPERLVYTMVVADAQGNAAEPAAAGMDPDWPRETVVTVTFVEHEGKTTVTLQQTVSESLAKRTGAYPSWLDMLDRLTDTLTEE